MGLRALSPCPQVLLLPSSSSSSIFSSPVIRVACVLSLKLPPTFHTRQLPLSSPPPPTPPDFFPDIWHDFPRPGSRLPLRSPLEVAMSPGRCEGTAGVAPLLCLIPFLRDTHQCTGTGVAKKSRSGASWQCWVGWGAGESVLASCSLVSLAFHYLSAAPGESTPLNTPCTEHLD